MHKVSGKVLVKETGVGIPNLQVVLYDLDNRADKSSPNNLIKSTCLVIVRRPANQIVLNMEEV